MKLLLSKVSLALITGLALHAVRDAAEAQNFLTHDYQAIVGDFTWQQAQADAVARGGHLATITSQAEMDHVRSIGVLPETPYWLGGTDQGHEGVWTWVTGEPWDFTLWHSSEPNNQGPENYLTSAAANNHLWNDFGTESSTVPIYLLEIEECLKHGARAEAQLVAGFVVIATVTDRGCGYTNAPLVLIQGGGGSGATATATIEDGRVTSIKMTSAGCCYTNVPSVVIASPEKDPVVRIKVSKVKVSQDVVLGRRYRLEASDDMVTWTPVGSSFVAESELVESEFDTEKTGRFFRLREVF